MSPGHFLPALLLVVSQLASPASADTPVVDISGGGDFPSIQAAVDAAAPDDVILVLPGIYSSFVLDVPASVIAQPGAAGLNIIVDGAVLVRDIPAGSRAGLSGLFMSFLFVQDNAGTLLCDVLGIGPPSQLLGPEDDFAIEIVDSSDVRMRQCGLNPGVSKLLSNSSAALVAPPTPPDCEPFCNPPD